MIRFVDSGRHRSEQSEKEPLRQTNLTGSEIVFKESCHHKRERSGKNSQRKRLREKILACLALPASVQHGAKKPGVCGKADCALSGEDVHIIAVCVHEKTTENGCLGNIELRKIARAYPNHGV